MAILDRVRKTCDTTPHAEHAETEATSPCCLHALWPALDANQSPVAVIISLAPAATFHQHATAVNEALLIAGLHQHEWREHGGCSGLRGVSGLGGSGRSLRRSRLSCGRSRLSCGGRLLGRL